MKALAMDLGASGGKIYSGGLQEDRLRMTELHRFHNEPVEVSGHLYWDILFIWRNLLEGLRKAAGEGVDSVGVDAFCNDYGLLDADGRLMNQIYMYRDVRTANVPARMDGAIDPLALYRATGCQRARFNTLVQLAAQTAQNDRFLLDHASSLLFVPDLLNFFLCGEKAAEYTIASVSQAYNRHGNMWDSDILRRFGISEHLFPTVVPSAVRLGRARHEVQDATGAGRFTVSTVCHHDTASAVMAVPARDPNFVYICSGTWCLMGTETRDMITSEEAFRMNFANEGGFGGTNRFLKNIMGLWIVQECRRELKRAGITRTFTELDHEAAQSSPFRSIIDPNDPRFFEPGNMIAKIQQQCAENGEPLPETPGEIVRCVQESLAMAFRMTLEQIENLAGLTASRVHIVGGGAQSALLCGFAASAMGRPVLAGPVDAAAAGNLCAQLIALGEIGGLEESREIIARSFEIMEYMPGKPEHWDEAYGRFKQIVIK